MSLSTNVSALVQPFLAGNAAWAAATNATNATFLPTLAQAQAPPVVWIGCADSRVPESVVTGQMLGQIFTTRNIANQVLDDDVNDATHAVIEYAVGHLNVSNVAVVGHTNCGGIKAAYKAYAAESEAPSADSTATASDVDATPSSPAHGHRRCRRSAPSDDPAESTALTRMLAPLIALRGTLPTNATIIDLTLANVQVGVNSVANSTAVRVARAAGREVCVHGWLYDLATGLIKDLGITQCSDSV